MALFVPRDSACIQDRVDPRDSECLSIDEYMYTFEGLAAYSTLPRVGITFKAYEFKEKRFREILLQAFEVLAEPCRALDLHTYCMFPKHWRILPLGIVACSYDKTIDGYTCHTAMHISHNNITIDENFRYLTIGFEAYSRDHEFTERRCE